MPIGYCFSYPAESVPGGDAKLLRWTKGVDIKEMVGEFIGKPLLDYLNERNKIKFTGIKVVNDTIASYSPVSQIIVMMHISASRRDRNQYGNFYPCR